MTTPPPDLRKILNDIADQLALALRNVVRVYESIPPEVRDGILTGKIRAVPHNPCLCLCGMHKDIATGICTGTAEIAVHTNTPTIGPHDVPLCMPCGRAWLQRAGKNA